MTVARVVLPTILIGLVAAQGSSAKVNVLVDIDSTHGLSGFPQYPIITQSDHISWNASNFYPVGNISMTIENLTLELTSSLGLGQELGSRNRVLMGGGGGGSYNDLLLDFAFSESPSLTSSPLPFLKLRIAGLDLGDYKMQSWHFDSLPTILRDNNAIQIEIGNSGAAQEVVINEFPFGLAPAIYGFSVTEIGQVKEITYRASGSTGAATRRTRLNGFTIVSVVPEPAAVRLAYIAILAYGGCWLFHLFRKSLNSGEEFFHINRKTWQQN